MSRAPRQRPYVALLAAAADGAQQLRVGRLEAAPPAAGGWAAPRWVHLAALALPPSAAGAQALPPAACRILDGPVVVLSLPVRVACGRLARAAQLPHAAC